MTVHYLQHKVVTSFGLGGGIAEISLTTFNVQIPEGLAIIGIYFIFIAILGLELWNKGIFRITKLRNIEIILDKKVHYPKSEAKEKPVGTTTLKIENTSK